ncbi:hypothetical protein Z517_10582 [Fonsecaea pedrosoi CBS 271.37]|uniref:Unplaced genomic scaffold supercont1.7, whole genome shotgun sequence n=1 Tax=Fonsecaea pedrosoi CBS 271.37 TaxID=1442368 RepID=A0A0D2EN71_9EURO|nr:uncharacterized protein Z517_10582 [Fonsecaea pedrosoi CBS 271.37]KIW75837.1 hypothetical protein Z517_10582 [Fonsecaea pedrosoi CBS 271.37]
MDFFEPRRAYKRAGTDYLELKSTEVELDQHTLASKASFTTTYTSATRDQSPLIADYSDPIRTDPSYFSGKSLRHRFLTLPKGLSGWRTGAITAALLGVVSFLINLVVVSWLTARGQGASLVEVYSGHCGKVESLDIWIHLAINTISTLLLGGSNYCMQCLCAPTREDVKRSHARGVYLDIGVPSVRNMRSISSHKLILWLALGLSSIPLHLMYNSAFYKSLEANDYNLFFVTQDFIDGKAQQEIQSSLLTHPETWERLEKKECIHSYATTFLTSRRNLILLSNNSTSQANESVLKVDFYTSGSVQAFDWICTSDPNMDSKVDMPYGSHGYILPCETWVSKVEAIASQWRPYDYDVEYCLSEQVTEKCSYNGNIPIIAIVLSCNAVKIVIMLFVAFRLKDNPLITVGDAVESFLNENETSTKGLCLLSKSDVVMAIKTKSHWSLRAKKGEGQLSPRVARLRTKRGLESASITRWSLTTGLTALALIAVAFLLAIATRTIKSYGFNIGSIGFGKVTQAGVITGWSIGAADSATSRILSSILIANLPQTIFSFLYLNLNGVLTSMWLAREWSQFASERKPLRVSKPKASQRSTHFLQLPYKVAVPLMVMSGALHWVISQSIFLAVVAEYRADGSLLDPTFIATCGFSPMAMIIVLVLGGLLVVVTLGLGTVMKYDASIPLVGSCSAAIAAACHQPSWDTDASLKAVQWGAIPGMDNSAGVGHCAFSSGEVEPVQDGRSYAGILDDMKAKDIVYGRTNGL